VSAIRHRDVPPGTLLCPRCGSALRGDQSWCLECGLAARTRIHPPPSWRMPVLVTCVVLALLAAGIAVALVALLDKPQATPTATTVTVPATAPATTTPAATVPTATTPLATAPTTVPTTTVPTVTTPAVTTPATTPSGGASPRTVVTVPSSRNGPEGP
jgi:hypothetical protein